LLDAVRASTAALVASVSSASMRPAFTTARRNRAAPRPTTSMATRNRRSKPESYARVSTTQAKTCGFDDLRPGLIYARASLGAAANRDAGSMETQHTYIAARFALKRPTWATGRCESCSPVESPAGSSAEVSNHGRRSSSLSGGFERWRMALGVKAAWGHGAGGVARVRGKCARNAFVPVRAIKQAAPAAQDAGPVEVAGSTLDLLDRQGPHENSATFPGDVRRRHEEGAIEWYPGTAGKQM